MSLPNFENGNEPNGAKNMSDKILHPVVKVNLSYRLFNI